MGRKEKIVNTSMASSAQASTIISKRTYTRQIHNKTNNQSESSTDTSEHVNMVRNSYNVRIFKNKI